MLRPPTWPVTPEIAGSTPVAPVRKALRRDSNPRPPAWQSAGSRSHPFAQTGCLQAFPNKRANGSGPERTPNLAILATQIGPRSRTRQAPQGPLGVFETGRRDLDPPPACHAGGRGFESRRSRRKHPANRHLFVACLGAIDRRLSNRSRTHRTRVRNVVKRCKSPCLWRARDQSVRSSRADPAGEWPIRPCGRVASAG
jgi:hypothetical protein